MPMIQCKLIIQVSDSVICCYSLVARLISRYFNFLHADEISALWSRQFRRNRKIWAQHNMEFRAAWIFFVFLKKLNEKSTMLRGGRDLVREQNWNWQSLEFLRVPFSQITIVNISKKMMRDIFKSKFFSLQIYRSLVMRIERFLAKIQIFLIIFRASDLHPKSIPHL